MGRSRSYNVSQAEAALRQRPTAGPGELLCEVLPLDRPAITIVLKVSFWVSSLCENLSFFNFPSMCMFCDIRNV